MIIKNMELVSGLLHPKYYTA